MGAFGSCLGVGRPMDATCNEHPFMTTDSSGLRSLFNGDFRMDIKLQASRQLARQNSYLADHHTQLPPRRQNNNNRSEFNVATAFGFSASKVNAVQKLIKQSYNKAQSHLQHQSNNNQQNANNNLQSRQTALIDIDDPIDKSETSNQQQAFNSKFLNNQLSICATTNGSNGFNTSQQLNGLDLNQQRQSPDEGKILICLHDYEKRTKDDLAFRKGDLLVAVGSLDPAGFWWLARSKRTNEVGYVPSNFVAELKSLNSEPWYFGKIGRLEAERCLKSNGNTDGAFIIRDADTNLKRYSLSLLHKNEVKHYRIHQTEQGFYLSKKMFFKSLHEFVAHYSANADGLCIALKFPCITGSDAKPLPLALSHDTCEQYEIDRSELTLGQELGHGQFGQVYEGLWKKITPVAIKTLKRGSMDPQEFITEARIMAQLRHDKLVRLYAVCTKEEPIYIVTELMKNGCLLNYLQRNKKHLDLRTLIIFACQIAEGMAYLEENNYLHRDLAARNILVGDNNIVKIADFGLARLIKETEYEARPYSKCPIKWTSPESITYNRYTSKSDVWSFGIVLYEIITYGNTPYAGMTNQDMLQQVERGYRMPITQMPNCPQRLYQIMLKCWNKEPQKRPAFAILRHELDNFFNE